VTPKLPLFQQDGERVGSVTLHMEPLIIDIIRYTGRFTEISFSLNMHPICKTKKANMKLLDQHGSSSSLLTGCEKHVFMYTNCSRHYQTKTKSWENISIVCLKEKETSKSIQLIRICLSYNHSDSRNLCGKK